MKTHELAEALNAIADILRAGPNVDMSELASVLAPKPKKQPSRSSDVNLSNLLQLSSATKQQLQEFIRAYEIPIEVSSKDGSRNILGKLLRYLENNPEAFRQIKGNLHRPRAGISKDLMNALDALLKDRRDETD